jgi:PAS domain S-box-containing protein
MTVILVLDDRATDRQLLATVLGYAGHEVLQAGTAEAGLELARTRQPDLIISDILMPDKDGYQVARELRGDPLTAGIAVIFCTAMYSLEEVRRLATACGVSHILVKPCEPEEITRVVNEILGETHKLGFPVLTERFDREHLRVINAKLVEKVHELETLNHEHELLHEQLRETETRASESFTLLETLLATAPIGLGFVDREFRLVRANQKLAAVNGAPIESQLGRRTAEIVPELWPQIEPVYRHVLDTGKAVVNVEVARPRGGGSGGGNVDLVSYYPVRVKDRIIGIGVVVVDITERKQDEEFRSVVMENMAEGLFATDEEGLVSFMNPAASRMLGWGDNELSGEPVAAIRYQQPDGSPAPPEDCDLLKVRSDGRTVRNDDGVFTRRDGTLLPVAYSAAPLLSGSDVRGVVVVFRDISEEKAEHKRLQRELDDLTWVGRIRDALDEGRMVLYAQPIIPLTGGERREELLLRMVGRDGEMIPPGSFLPSAEKYGLISEIDQWVITQAMALAAGGRKLTANLSAQSVGGADMLPLIERQLRECGTDPVDIVFEITETALMKTMEAGETFARGIAELGCPLALDDFGTGFGSFTYLKRLPIQYLKIDIEFVRDLISSPANQHVVKAIVSLAEGFGQQTIAEGVEDAETLALLKQYGVDFAQGYHLGRPAPLTTPQLVRPKSAPPELSAA